MSRKEGEGRRTEENVKVEKERKRKGKREKEVTKNASSIDTMVDRSFRCVSRSEGKRAEEEAYNRGRRVEDGGRNSRQVGWRYLRWREEGGGRDSRFEGESRSSSDRGTLYLVCRSGLWGWSSLHPYARC